MKHYTNKSNARRAAVTRVAKEQGISKDVAKERLDEFVVIEEMMEGWEINPIEKILHSIGTGLKIEKDRPEQNGIIRPSAGGKCRAIWDACDAQYAKGVFPMPKIMKQLAEENGWNANNAVIEMYQWRKFTDPKKEK